MSRNDCAAAHVFDFREIADYVVEHDDTATAANALRNAQDEIDRLRRELATREPNQYVMNRRAER